MPATVQSRALARAAEVLGGVAALSDFLHVPQSELMRWIKGEAPPTLMAFRDAVDLLLEADTKHVSRAVVKRGSAKSRAVTLRR